MSDIARICVICNRKVRLTDKHYEIFKCDYCTHVFTVKKCEDSELYSDTYFLKTHKNWFNNPDYRLFSFVHKNIKKLLKKDSLAICDLGCGKGVFLKYYRRLDSDSELFGVDLVRNSYPSINFISEDFSRLDINKKFDVMCSFSVIEHLGEPQLFVDKIKKYLSADGVVIISTINNNSMIHKIGHLLKQFGIKSAYERLYSSHHLQYFTNKSLRFLLEKNGFQVILQENHNYPLKAIDVPEAGKIARFFYLLIVYVIFTLQAVFKNGILQTVVCRNK